MEENSKQKQKDFYGDLDKDDMEDLAETIRNIPTDPIYSRTLPIRVILLIIIKWAESNQLKLTDKPTVGEDTADNKLPATLQQQRTLIGLLFDDRDQEREDWEKAPKAELR